jgi:histone acetyltransferase (RNA polymerase elongator complex component)
MTLNEPSKASNQKPATRSRPFIIPIFVPHAGCPHRCVFCNQSSITGTHSVPTGREVRRQIETFLSYRHNQGRPVQIAFFGGNFLGIQSDTINRLLSEATTYVTAGRAGSIRFSTRPDTVDHQRLTSIQDFPVTTIELGVQSMNDRVLKHSNRGHTAEDTIRAAQLLKEYKYKVGVQIMVGLPGDNIQRLHATARAVLRLEPDFIRIYPTVVMAGSPLAALYGKGDYTPLSLEEAVFRVKELYLFFKKEDIPVIRMGLQASEELNTTSTVLAGPYHPAFGHLVHSEIFLTKAMTAIASEKIERKVVRLHVHPRSVSKMRGQKNRNIKILCKRFALLSVEIVADDSLNVDQLLVHVMP